MLHPVLQALQGLGLHSLGSGMLPGPSGPKHARPVCCCPQVSCSCQFCSPKSSCCSPGLHSHDSSMQAGLSSPQPVDPACSAMAPHPQVFLLQGQACPA